MATAATEEYNNAAIENSICNPIESCTLSSNTIDCDEIFSPAKTDTYDIAGGLSCTSLPAETSLAGEISGAANDNAADKYVIFGLIDEICDTLDNEENDNVSWGEPGVDEWTVFKQYCEDTPHSKLPKSWDKLELTRLTVAIDLEWFEKTDGNQPTEVGLSIIPNGNSEYVYHLHLIIHEHSHLKNRYCKSARIGYLFGFSQIVSVEEAAAILEFWLFGAKLDLPVKMVGHGLDNDLKTMRAMGINTNDIKDICDLQKEFKLSKGRSLGQVCSLLNLVCDTYSFHNAGIHTRTPTHTYV